MNYHLGLVVARMHGVLVARPRSGVFHVYAGPLTPSGRYIPHAARTVCRAYTRRLSVLERDGSVLDLDGRRMCARCRVRLVLRARRTPQPIRREACEEFYAGLTLADIVVATALTETVDETHRVSFALGLRFPPPPLRRPDPVTDRDIFRGALFDVHAALLRRRRHLVALARTPEEIEAARRQREIEAEDDARLLAAHRRGARVARAQDRANRGQYVTEWERPLLQA